MDKCEHLSELQGELNSIVANNNYYLLQVTTHLQKILKLKKNMKRKINILTVTNNNNLLRTGYNPNIGKLKK